MEELQEVSSRGLLNEGTRWLILASHPSIAIGESPLLLESLNKICPKINQIILTSPIFQESGVMSRHKYNEIPIAYIPIDPSPTYPELLQLIREIHPQNLVMGENRIQGDVGGVHLYNIKERDSVDILLTGGGLKGVVGEGGMMHIGINEPLRVNAMLNYSNMDNCLKVNSVHKYINNEPTSQDNLKYIVAKAKLVHKQRISQEIDHARQFHVEPFILRMNLRNLEDLLGSKGYKIMIESGVKETVIRILNCEHTSIHILDNSIIIKTMDRVIRASLAKLIILAYRLI